jgi:hypothetical protein
MIKLFAGFFRTFHNPTQTNIAKMMSPTITGASSCTRKTIIAIITIKAIIPTIVVPIPPNPNSIADLLS